LWILKALRLKSLVRVILAKTWIKIKSKKSRINLEKGENKKSCKNRIVNAVIRAILVNVFKMRHWNQNNKKDHREIEYPFLVEN